MLIEFTGSSGSGKTTIARKVVEGLRKRGLTIISFPMERFLWIRLASRPSLQNLVMDIIALCWIFRCFGENMVLLKESLRVLARQHVPFFGRSGFLNIGRGVVRKIGLYRLTTSKKFQNQIVIVDEGISHIVHNIFVHPNISPNQDSIETFAQLLPCPDALVYVRSPLVQLIKRTEVRKDPPRKLHNKNLFCYLNNANVTFQSFMAIYSKQNRSLFIDNDSDCGNFFHSLAGRVIDFIVELK
jgi:thymidylate kinase